ncbi:MAG: 23S rRNA (pseudouridine(1915)-N(3))-methyltransferase RlmH [Thermoanaerobaculia bacterium]
MKFRLIWIRSTSDTEFRAAIDRYAARIRHFFPLEMIEVAPEKGRKSKSDQDVIRAESKRLLEAIPAQGFTTVLDERGELIDSLKFARWLERMTVDQPHGVNFVVGGDLGLSNHLRERGDRVLALSPMTLPHQLARVVLLEQIYRACTLIRNVSYHK